MKVGTDLIIARVDKARMLLAEARDAGSAKQVMDMAHAAEIYARRQDLGEQAIGYAHEIKIDAQALLGAFLALNPKNPGAKGTGSNQHEVRSRNGTAPPTLADLRITKQVSSDSQLLAAVSKKEPKIFEDIKKRRKTLRDVKRTERRKVRVAHINGITEGNRELSTATLYPVVLCDPPWRYEHCETDSRQIENQYPTMGLDEICALPVPKITTPDSVCFMWVTSPKLAEALRVLDAWGFTYRTCAVWVKDKIGMGYYFRQQHELLLVATKGELPVPEPTARPSSVINGPREAHSAKPKCVHEMIAGMYPEFAKIELFCRDAQPGWAVWGNQA